MSRTRTIRFWSFAATAIAFGVYLLFPQAPSGPTLKVYMLDVGQGDAALIETPGGKRIVVDGGPGNALAAKLGEYVPLRSRRIDTVVMTHPHSDHISGFAEVLKTMDVGEVWHTGVPHTTQIFFRVMSAIKQNGIEVRLIQKREIIHIDDGVTVEILFPTNDISGLSGVFEDAEKGDERDNLNNTSIVFRLRYGNTSFLFTGDAEKLVEETLLSDGVDLQADVLKVSHHGSQSGTHWEFLEAVKPSIALIGVGAQNDFGHPHRRLLRRLRRIGAEIYRTDIHGDILIESDGKNISVKTEK